MAIIEIVGFFKIPLSLTPLKYGRCFLYGDLTFPEQRKVVSEGDDFLFALKETRLNPLTVNLMRPFPHKSLTKEE